MSPNKDETGLEMLAGLYARENSFGDVAFNASMLNFLMLSDGIYHRHCGEQVLPYLC